VRLVLGQQLGKRQVIAGERIDAIEHDAAGDTVVAMPSVEVRVRPLGALRDDQAGAPAADLARDVEPELPLPQRTTRRYGQARITVFEAPA
jgi:hypothetical protein